MSKTTPGPWRWGDWGAQFGSLEWAPNRRTLEHNPAHPGDPDAVVRVWNDGASRVLYLESMEEISEPDAELIRRAPELLNALCEMLDQFGGNMDLGLYRQFRALVTIASTQHDPRGDHRE